MAIVTNRGHQYCVLSETQLHPMQILLFGPLKIATMFTTDIAAVIQVGHCNLHTDMLTTEHFAHHRALCSQSGKVSTT